MSANDLLSTHIRVVLAEDEIDMQNIITDTLKRAADIEMVGIGDNGQVAITLCERMQPNVLLLDIAMPTMNGFKAANIVQERFPQIKILILSSLDDRESIKIMLEKKISGYVDKSAVVHNLANDIRAAYYGSIVFSPKVFDAYKHGGEKPASKDYGLTEREMEILNLMKAGLNMPEIAIELKIGKTTVKTHVEKVIKKFGVATRSEALVFAAENRLP